MESYQIQPIAHIHTDLPDKFGIPRQSGLVEALKGRIVFLPAYRNPDTLRGIEGYSHLWLLWRFSKAEREGWSATVRPPRLGGNARMGVFATRSPFRPNRIGLSCVKLEGVEWDTPQGAVLVVSGVDLLDGTPILDIKPYLPFTDSRPEAVGGFAAVVYGKALEVVCEEALLAKLPEDKRQPLLDLLAQDPRPSYQSDPERVYGFPYAGWEVRFTVEGDILTVREIAPAEE